MVTQGEVNKFLDSIRASGSINMFGAGEVLQQAFGLKRYEAKDMLLEWMQTFSERVKNGEVEGETA